MNDGRPPERWCFICDIRADGGVPPHVIARRLLKCLLRRWGIKCKGLSIDRRMFDLTEENKRLKAELQRAYKAILEGEEEVNEHDV